MTPAGTAIDCAVALQRTARRMLCAAAGAMVLLVIAAATAAASDGGDGLEPAGSDDRTLSNTLFPFLKIEDSRGYSIEQYQLNVHMGSVPFDVHKMIWAIPTQILWSMYQIMVGFTSWLFSWIIEFSWLRVITAPFRSLSDGVSSVINTVGLTGTLLIVGAAVCLWWVVRGMWALGTSELLVSLLIASAATTILSNPMDRIAGEDGLLYSARDLGVEIAVQVANTGDDEPIESVDDIGDSMAAMLVDTFIRQPHQLINYGTQLDGTECEEAYNEAIAMQPIPERDRDSREHVGDCNEQAYEHADNPDQLLVWSAGLMPPASLLLLALIIGISISLFIAVVVGLWQAVKALYSTIVGVVPGGGRGMFWRNMTDAAMALTLVAMASVFAAGFMHVIKGVFDNTGNSRLHILPTLALIDLLLIAGIIAVWRYHRSIRQAGERLAQKLASMRPGKATPVPAKSTIRQDAMSAARKIHTYRTMRKLTSQPSGAQNAPRTDRALPSAGTSASTTSATTQSKPARRSSTLTLGQAASGQRSAIGPGQPGKTPLALGPGTGTPGAHPQGESPNRGRLQLALTAGKAVAAIATGGTSAAVSSAAAAGKAAGAAQRAGKAISAAGKAKQAKAAAKLRGSTTRTPGQIGAVPAKLTQLSNSGTLPPTNARKPARGTHQQPAKPPPAPARQQRPGRLGTVQTPASQVPSSTGPRTAQTPPSAGPGPRQTPAQARPAPSRTGSSAGAPARTPQAGRRRFQRVVTSDGTVVLTPVADDDEAPGDEQ